MLNILLLLLSSGQLLKIIPYLINRWPVKSHWISDESTKWLGIEINGGLMKALKCFRM